MTSEISVEIQSLAPTSIIEMLVLDMTPAGAGKAYFHAGTNGLMQPIVWQGQVYDALPMETEGFNVVTKGALPRPKIRVANINGLLSAEVVNYDDLVGCRVIRKRTFAKFLDAVNFPGGVNPDADPTKKFTDDVWYIDSKTSENKYMIEWELASAFDVQGVQLPFRQVIQNSCAWDYRGPECGWMGGYYDKNDQPTYDQKKDVCSKKLTGCKCRHGATAVLPFGGFPGAHRVNY